MTSSTIISETANTKASNIVADIRSNRSTRISLLTCDGGGGCGGGDGGGGGGGDGGGVSVTTYVVLHCFLCI